MKRAKLVQPGDRVDIRLPPYEHRVLVRAVAERRGPAAAAALLYEETAERVAGRERVVFQLKAAHVLFVPETNERPTKRRPAAAGAVQEGHRVGGVRPPARATDPR